MRHNTGHDMKWPKFESHILTSHSRHDFNTFPWPHHGFANPQGIECRLVSALQSTPGDSDMAHSLSHVSRNITLITYWEMQAQDNREQIKGLSTSHNDSEQVGCNSRVAEKKKEVIKQKLVSKSKHWKWSSLQRTSFILEERKISVHPSVSLAPIQEGPIFQNFRTENQPHLVVVAAILH